MKNPAASAAPLSSKEPDRPCRRHPLQHLNLNPDFSSASASLRFHLPNESLRSKGNLIKNPAVLNNNNNNRKKKKRSKNKVIDGDDDGCLNNVTPLHRSKRGKKDDSISEESSSKTPPVQASVSPEIQMQIQFRCSSSMSTSASTLSRTMTPGCYAAGHHVVSGITDKRKCRPRGLLVVTTAHNDSPSDASIPLHLPAHASMHWLRLSPTDAVSPITSLHTPFDDASPSCSATPPPRLLNSTNSPFSLHSLATTTTTTSTTGNLIHTPASDSTSHDDLLCLSAATANKITFNSQLNSVTECLRMTTLSPVPNTTTLDVEPLRNTASIDFSFQFDSLTASPTSVDLTKFRQPLDDQNSCNSCCSSQSKMRASSRDRLMSEIYEVDEFDCCRCLSDEKDHDNSNNTCTGADILDDDLQFEAKSQRLQEEIFPAGSCAESVSTDGGSLLASSRDSDSGFVLEE